MPDSSPDSTALTAYGAGIVKGLNEATADLVLAGGGEGPPGGWPPKGLSSGDDGGEVDLSTLTLDELAERIGLEHAQVERSVSRALAHAIQVGLLVIEIESRREVRPRDEWWKEHIPLAMSTVRQYVRLAHNRHMFQDGMSITQATEAVIGLPSRRGPGVHVHELRVVEARRLLGEGKPINVVAKETGMGWETVKGLADPEYQRKARERARARGRRAAAARKALKEQQQREERDRLARERGGNLGKAYDQVRKLQPVIDAAIAEGLTVEARALLVRVEDEIFKALKRQP